MDVISVAMLETPSHLSCSGERIKSLESRGEGKKRFWCGEPNEALHRISVIGCIGFNSAQKGGTGSVVMKIG